MCNLQISEGTYIQQIDNYLLLIINNYYFINNVCLLYNLLIPTTYLSYSTRSKYVLEGRISQ